MTARAEDEAGVRLAELALAGRSIVERQLELALELDCERIVCLAPALDKLAVELQHRAEAAGTKFNLIAGPHSLLGLVSAADELFVFADGLLPAAEEAQDLLARGPGVLVLPVEEGIAAGFERIDLNHAWAGILCMPGSLVERLSQLPPDCDAVSALLRISLQGRVPERPLARSVLAEHRWALVMSERQLADFEPEWLRQLVPAPNPFSPGSALARMAMRHQGSSLIARGWRPYFLHLAGLAAGLAGVACAWFSQAWVAILLCGLGWLLAEAATALASITDAGGKRTIERDEAAGWALDLCLLAVLTLSTSEATADRAFAPLVLLALLRISKALIGARWGEGMGDRFTLALILTIAAAFGMLLPAIELLSVAILAILLALVQGRMRLTQV